MSKKLLITIGAIVVVAVVVIVVLLTVTGNQDEALVVISMKTGSVSVMKMGATDSVEASVGQSLAKGDTVTVADGAQAQVTFSEGTTIDLESGTVLEITELIITTDTGPNTITLKQEIGRTISRVTKLADPASRYEVETPTGVAAVRGTVMEVNVDQQGTSRIFTREGLVAAIAQGVTVLVPEGEHSIILPGQPPSQPLEQSSQGAGVIDIKEGILTEQGDTITYIYEVTNLGSTSQSNVYVGAEDVQDIIFVGGDDNGNGSLDPGETWIYTGTAAVSP